MAIDFSPYRALIVDDNDFMRAMLRQQLNMFGFENIGEATDGFEAVEHMDEYSADLVICDINMQPLDGFDFLKHVKKMPEPANKTPVIFLTAHADRMFVDRALSLAVDAYLLKPVEPEKLYIAIRKVMPIK